MAETWPRTSSSREWRTRRLGREDTLGGYGDTEVKLSEVISQGDACIQRSAHEKARLNMVRDMLVGRGEDIFHLDKTIDNDLVRGDCYRSLSLG